MHFAYPLPWWLVGVLVGAIGAAVFVEYRRPLSPLTRLQRSGLMALRGAVLAGVVLFLFRPIIVLPPSANRDAIVPVLVDVSRSMRLPDDTGRTRAARAAAVVTTQVLPSLSGHYQPELFGIGDGLSPISPEGLHADARRTDLAGAVAAVREQDRQDRRDGQDRAAAQVGLMGRRCLPSGSDRLMDRAIARCWASRPVILAWIMRPSICT